MSDIDAIAIAVAARYAPAQVTPPATYTNIRSATADLPNAITALPAVLIFTDSGKLDAGGGTRIGKIRMLARFYLGTPKNLARDQVKLRRWLTVLIDQHRLALQLGGLVVRIRTIGWRIGMMTYGTTDYSGIELELEIETSEAWTPSA